MFACSTEPQRASVGRRSVPIENGVSVIIPVRDRRTMLCRALDSVMAQTHPAQEIIVVDDGSRDGVAGMLPVCYPGVRLIQTRGLGVSAARNAGIRAACQPWCALLDSDDAWRPRRLQRQLEAAAANPDVRLWHCDERWWRNGEHLNQKRYHRKRAGDVFEDSLARCVISPSAALVHHSLWLDVGLFDETLPACEDYDLWLRVTAREPVGFVPDVLVDKHGGHDDQLSHKVPALDRYRIRALHRLLERVDLDEHKTRAVRSMLARKTRIYAAGARRRGRHAEAHELEQALCRQPS